MEYICKPTKIKIYVNTGYKTMAQIKAETGCDAIINGGLFEGSPFYACRRLRVDNKTVMDDGQDRWGLAWDKNVVRCSQKHLHYHNFIACVCLVRDGKPEPTLDYTKDMKGARQRTAMGVFPDDRVWLYATHSGTTPEQLQKIALEAGAKHAIMLDGGGSTQCIFPDGTLTSTRKVHNFICVWTDDKPQKEETPQKKDLNVIAKEVISGKWGTGVKRKNALTAAGYDYNAVQAIVNKLLR